MGDETTITKSGNEMQTLRKKCIWKIKERSVGGAIGFLA
jgi:hypothetical protein